MIRLAGFVLLTAAAAMARGEVHAINSTYNLYYSSIKIGVVGVVTESFTRESDQYRIESIARPVKLAELFLPTLKEISVGTVTQQGLRPTHFSHSLSNDEAKTLMADFLWDQNAIDLKFDGKVERRQMLPMAQDALSMKYQFQFAPPAAGEIELAIANGKNIAAYRYRLVAEEAIETPAGKFDTAHYAKIAQAGESKLDIWLTRDEHHFPVRIVAEEKGHSVEQVLTKVTFN